jgi:sugar lactone lactonase YvrE
VWKTEDFGASPINWRVLQHPNGLVYVANNFGILEFDGATWRLIAMPREGAARALAVDARGTVWAAGNGELCKLEPDAAGSLRAVDVTDRLPAGDRVFGTLNRALVTHDGVYFSGDRRIFLFREDGVVRVWRTEGNFAPIWQLDDVVHVTRDYRELVRLRPDGGVETLAPFEQPDAPLLLTLGAERDRDAWLLFTRQGPMRWSGLAQAAPVPLDPGAVESGNPLRVLVRLEDRRLVAGSVQGLTILSPEGRPLQRIDTKHGLPVDTVNGLATDRDGGLWVALQNGIARLQLDSPFAVHGAQQGVESGPRRLTRWRDRLYVALGSGLAVRDPATGRFEIVPGVRTGANRPIVVDDRLLVSTAAGVVEVLPTGRGPVWSRHSGIPLVASKRVPGWLFHGDSDGLYLMASAAGGWRIEGRLVNLPANVVQIHDSDDGYLWIVGALGEIWRVDFRAGLRLDAPCEQFDAARGVPPARRRDHVQLLPLGEELFAVGKAWFLRYEPAQSRFVPGPDDFGRDPGIDAFDVSDPANVWLRVAEPQSRVLRVTFPASGATGATVPRAAIESISAPELGGLIVNSIFHEAATRTLWIAGQGTLLSMDTEWRPHSRSAEVLPRVRRIESARGETLYGGGAPAGHHRFPAQQNALRFHFAAPTFAPDYQGRSMTQYRTRIEGLDTDWTAWTHESYRDVTRLPASDFVFQVQARPHADHAAGEARLTFSVLPPWWLTWWAFGIYAALGTVGVASIVRLRTRALRHRSAELERTVAQRTAELAAQNAELARLRQLETEEKIAARLAEEKARLEVLRYQLNPHFLFNAFTSVCAELPPQASNARSILERLTDFCRLTLSPPTGDEFPTLGDELRLLDTYLAIEKSRWGDLLKVELAIAPVAEAERIPPLLLLPLVENALKYGARTSRGGVALRLTAQRDHNGLFLEVANTGEWITPEQRGAVPSLGIGLANLRQRLQRYYPGCHRFSTEARDGWVFVRLRLGIVDTPATV